jgi:hypothetical protein
MIRNFSGVGAIAPRSLVKFGSADGVVVQASSELDNIIGIADSLGLQSNGRVDVLLFDEIGEVKLGGSVTRGDHITSNASGFGVKLTDVMLAAGPANSIATALESGVNGDIIYVIVERQKISKIDEIASSTAELNALNGAPLDASFVIGSEASNVINVGVQLKDADGADLAVRGSIFAYLSDDANGDSVVANAPDGGIVIGTDGLSIPVVAGKAFQLTSEADGDIDLNITHAAGAKTCYLVLRLPNGKLKASTAITFA